MSTKEQLYKLTNTISELSKLLSDKLWNDEDIKDRFILAAFADGIHSAANELDELDFDLHDPNDIEQQLLDKDSGKAG